MKKFSLSTWFYFLIPSILGDHSIYDSIKIWGRVESTDR